MELICTQRSPYARKARVCLIELGLQDRVKLNLVNLDKSPPELKKNNPFAKVPTLILDDGGAIFDSPLVCEYLDSLSGKPKLFPPIGPARWTAQRRHTLANGILETLSMRRHEVRRPAGERSASEMLKQKGKGDAALAVIESEAALLGSDEVTIGEIAIGCCLGYMDFRFAEEPWRGSCPTLAKWFDVFSKRKSMIETIPPPGGH